MEYGLIGQKLGHSFSKLIHNEICDYDYELCELEKEEICSFFTNKKFKAVNVTIPYKQEVMQYIDCIDKNALQIGAVNTVVNKNGVLYGYNTDFSGMCALINKMGADLNGKKVLILGSGGTSKTAFAVALSLGAKTVERVSRSANDGAISYETMYAKHTDADFIINTTPLGMYPNNDGCAVDLDKFTNLSGVADAVYNPLCTTLVLNAKNRGINAMGGLYMLVAQAVFAATLFTGKTFDENCIDTVYKKLLLSQQNIVLIGMPGCGKSTMGKLLSSRLGREFIDTDEVIEQVAGTKISEIFALQGENAFRDIESDVIKSVSKTGGKIIATGGGAVLRPQNVFALRQNGFIIFLNRDLENLPATDSRPLSNNREKLEKLYKTRLPIYRSVCDTEINTVYGKQQNLNKIIEVCGLESNN